MPRLLLTTGDPNGIGPEIILKIFEKGLSEKYNLFIAGNKKIFGHYSRLLKVNSIPDDKMIEIPLPEKFKIKTGQIDAKAGRFSGDCIKAAARLCMKKEFDALITLPINKDSLNKGGYKFPGHTEMLTKLTHSPDTAMILYSKKISVCALTGHVPLRDVTKRLQPERIIRRIILINNSLVRDFKIKSPALALLAVNPHGGDGGTIGDEEIKILNPIVVLLRSMGFNINGPFPADGFFASGHYKDFDLTFSVYHDQGLIPFKMLSFERGINFTAGLKIIRTSPAHGTAFDIAGQGKAKISGTLEAIKLAYKMCRE